MSGHSWQRSNDSQRVANSAAMRPASGQRRQRNDESWIEVASHPSSSSVSSIGDEIVTTGLQVGSSYNSRRRRRLHPQYYPRPDSRQPTFVAAQAAQAGQAGANSSQEEYEESESEDDRVLTSSVENIASPQRAGTASLRRSAQPVEDDSSDDDDDDDRATALAQRPSEPFQPQPNAFTHPPSHLTHRHSTSSTIPQHNRPSFGQRSQTRVDPLRASLTTLLSCAAAAGKRTKDGEKQVDERSPAAAGNQPVELRFVPESELMAGPPPPAQARPSQSSRTTPPAATARESAGEKIKRTATPTPPTKSPRATKKKRTGVASGEDTLISPTLLTWVVNAGVVVLVSVVGFGAGYVIGREVGRQETLGSLGSNASAVANGSSCGRDVIKGGGGTLRRFHWGSAIGKSVAA
ncbi:uncharacterized protein F4812DRAFT_452172 [Daldinia caldariorum]|uniref:uncharacterized protein n=1 Tax=Daldinia caldariorum TaxID=326644 RepID=UPI0020088EC3|nr:uncharacterized protein F4812DRAFT_452172 [Daldinia caldariorum]KAI1465632.1 hypothetical protein F4812DRAFT_452172 [Daldinia caldariorum]